MGAGLVQRHSRGWISLVPRLQYVRGVCDAQLFTFPPSPTHARPSRAGDEAGYIWLNTLG
jgi:hypothetical protein